MIVDCALAEPVPLAGVGTVLEVENGTGVGGNVRRKVRNKFV